jgi:hypothetical protein
MYPRSWAESCSESNHSVTRLWSAYTNIGDGTPDGYLNDQRRLSYTRISQDCDLATIHDSDVVEPPDSDAGSMQWTRMWQQFSGEEQKGNEAT